MQQPRQVYILLNRKAGQVRNGNPHEIAAAICQPFQERGDKVDLRFFMPANAKKVVEQLSQDPTPDLIVVGGGDGTLSLFASRLFDHSAHLAFLPLGTMNLFVRSLQLPLDPVEAARLIAHGRSRRIDMGMVNGQHFLHHVSLGLHPKLVRHRNTFRYGSAAGKIAASARAFFLTIRRPPRLAFSLQLDEQNAGNHTSSAVVISNNLLGAGHLPYPDRLNESKLGIYICTGNDWQEILKVGVDTIVGRIDNNPHMKVASGKHVTLQFSKREKRRFRASIDGELTKLNQPILARSLPQALKVMVPSRTA